MIVKSRNTAASWVVGGTTIAATDRLVLDTNGTPATGLTVWNSTHPTDSVFTVGTGMSANAVDYVAYLFASKAGISMVGTYTGNGTNQTIACGFSAGAKFVMIKRTDSTGDWRVFDTQRGIVAGTDPSLAANGTAAETAVDAIDPDNTGFIVNQEATLNLNVSSATYIYLAFA
jgi:hypothetical protein